MKTKDDWFEFILFKLIDVDLTGIKTIAVDFDGEIVMSKCKMRITDNTQPPDGDKFWESYSQSSKDSYYSAVCTRIFLDPVMPDYDKIYFEL